GPFQRAVHLGRNVVALWRPAHDLEVLYRFYLRLTCGRVDVVSRQRDIEPLSPDQLSVSDAPRGIRFHGDHALADGELIDGDGKSRGCHLQQNSPGLGSDAPHGPAIGLNSIRSAGSALVDGDVGAAHDASGLVVCDVQFIGHHLPESGAGALATVRLPDVEGRCVVFVNDDPRIELSEVGVRIGARSLGTRIRGKWTGCRRRAEADDEQSRTLDEVPPGDRSVPLLQELFDPRRNVVYLALG